MLLGRFIDSEMALIPIVRVAYEDGTSEFYIGKIGQQMFQILHEANFDMGNTLPDMKVKSITVEQIDLHSYFIVEDNYR